MASERNRILKIVEYLNSCGIEVKIGKNKARGNKGFFATQGATFRIDIAKGQSEDVVERILTHEFAHYVHYRQDKTLKNLDFIFRDCSDTIMEELISLTVESIPKESVEPLFKCKKELELEICKLENLLKEKNIGLKKDVYFSQIEKKIINSSLKYLLKYDKVKVVECFSTKLYSIDDLGYDKDIDLYLRLKSKQRFLKRINSKISKLNKYYNSPTELFARSFEYFIYEKIKFKEIAPYTYRYYEELLNGDSLPILKGFIKLYL